ncbi:hypothetical protein EJ06DRAFT_528732 [Trichodelitschia bisporula]|uniref:Uncharacterized protein n=1 Tax=Trichodelitschia bisporula TaxID=703511 RepID=A0A6G1I3D4_9PEZI|nr:hypothetical protein EJ06DRAFT_528732 [Trichodelitschia bisporula]
MPRPALRLVFVPGPSRAPQPQSQPCDEARAIHILRDVRGMMSFGERPSEAV